MAVWAGVLFGLAVTAVVTLAYGILVIGSKFFDPAITAGAIALALSAMAWFTLLFKSKSPS